MKKLETLKKAKSIMMAVALILSAGTMVFLSSCEEGGEETSPVVGTWVITSAELNETTPYPVPLGPEPYSNWPAGTDVAAAFGGVVAAAGPCDNPANTAIELTSDQKMLYVCLGEATAPDETGSWIMSQDGTVLTISIVTELGGSTVTVPLNLTDFTATATSLSGTIDEFKFFPSTEGAATPTGFVQTVSMDVSFTKVTQ